MSKKGHVLLTKNGKSEIPSQLDEILEAAKSEADKDLVIWIHGGLVDRSSAEAQIPIIGESLEGRGVFPIFLVWQSGLATTLPDAILAFLIRKIGEHGTKLLENLIGAKLAFQAPKGSGMIGEDPYELNAIDRRAIEEAVKASPELMDEQAHLFGDGRGFSPVGVISLTVPPEQAQRAAIRLSDPMARMDGHLVRAAGEEQTRTKGFDLGLGIALILTKVAAAVLDRFRRRRAHQLRSTILEEFIRVAGLPAEVWTEIKGDAERHFEADGAGLRLFQMIRQLLEDNPERKVFLVGHSTGGVMINKILESDLDIEKFHIRLLASAARMSDTARALEASAGRIGSIRSFMLNPADEQNAPLISEWKTNFNKDWLNPLYIGSLLYLVSGALEEPQGDVPLCGMSRFVSAADFFTDEESEEMLAYIKVVQGLDPNGLVTAKTSGALLGYQCNSSKHGDFSTDKATLESLLFVP